MKEEKHLKEKMTLRMLFALYGINTSQTERSHLCELCVIMLPGCSAVFSY